MRNTDPPLTEHEKLHAARQYYKAVTDEKAYYERNSALLEDCTLNLLSISWPVNKEAYRKRYPVDFLF